MNTKRLFDNRFVRFDSYQIDVSAHYAFKYDRPACHWIGRDGWHHLCTDLSHEVYDIKGGWCSNCVRTLYRSINADND